jgi:hypothetical protein
MKKQTKIAIGAISLLAVVLYFVFKRKKGVGEIGQPDMPDTSLTPKEEGIKYIINYIATEREDRKRPLTPEKKDEIMSILNKMSDGEIHIVSLFAQASKDLKAGAFIDRDLFRENSRIMDKYTTEDIFYFYS